MARVRNYNEGQSHTVTFTFLNNGVPASPLTARYRIDCLTTGNVIKDWTVIESPGQVQTVAVGPSDNRIINQRNESERRQMVMQTNFDTEEQSVSDSEWTVKNLQGVR
jgi:hypothetical protein